MSLTRIKNAVVPFLKFTKSDWQIETYIAKSPFDLNLDENLHNPVLTADSILDISAAYVADPFIINEKGSWYMFFEVFEKPTDKGVICLAVSDDGLSWSYKGIVLSEQFHLSYPYVFKWDENYYMIPESAKANCVRLYKAVDFPTRWSFIRELLVGIHLDPSIFRFDGMWWMFSQTNPKRSDTLRLFYAQDLLGPWTEHPKSPIIDGNPHIARPGGRVLEFNGRRFRIAQDDYPSYGSQLFAFEISELTVQSYREKQFGDGPVLKKEGKWLLSDRIHHMDAHMIREGEWIVVIDHSHSTWQIRLEFS